MHDIAYFEKAGIPAVALLSDAFKPQAQYQAKSLGLESAARVFVKHPISDQTTSAIYQKADSVYAAVVERLISVNGWTKENDDGSSANIIAEDCNT